MLVELELLLFFFLSQFFSWTLCFGRPGFCDEAAPPCGFLPLCQERLGTKLTTCPCRCS